MDQENNWYVEAAYSDGSYIWVGNLSEAAAKNQFLQWGNDKRLSKITLGIKPPAPPAVWWSSKETKA